MNSLATERKLLETAYSRFHQGFYRGKDPVSFVGRFKNEDDREIAAFFGCLLAYGNVTSIFRILTEVFERLGPHPRQTLGDRNFDFSGLQHRWTTGEDLQIVAHWLAESLDRFSSLETLFLSDGKDTKTRLENMVETLWAQKLPKSLKVSKTRTRNLRYLVPSPKRKSACKRLNMFLRWVARPDDGIDLGLWKKTSPADLVLPLDTHLFKVVRELNWSQRKTANWQTAEEATERLRRHCPEDPIKYDFSLCHLYMERESLSMLKRGRNGKATKKLGR